MSHWQKWQNSFSSSQESDAKGSIKYKVKLLIQLKKIQFRPNMSQWRTHIYYAIHVLFRGILFTQTLLLDIILLEMSFIELIDRITEKKSKYLLRKIMTSSEKHKPHIGKINNLIF